MRKILKFDLVGIRNYLYICTMKHINQQQHITDTTPYMGIEITKAWSSSNFLGTVTHYATLPNGQSISSPVRKYVTKRIKKYFTEGK